MDIDHIKELTLDPKNVRRHTPRNVAMIEESLQQIGAARSIVIDEEGTVLAGNATIEAAGNVGLEKLRVVDATGDEIIAVRRTGLTPEQKLQLSLFDNRTGELALWDEEAIAELAKEGVDLSPYFFPEELAALLGGEITSDGEAQPELTDLQYRIIVDCRSEEEQTDLLARFESEGLTCRALMS